MRQSQSRKKYLYAFPCVVLITIAIFIAGVSRTSAASETDSGVFLLRTGIPHSPRGPFEFDMKLSQGKLLVAAGSIGDPRFRETVILLLRYDSSGAMGLILNVPTTVNISSAFPQIKELRAMTGKLFVGGPVGANQLFLLIRTDSPPEGSFRVFKHTYISSSMKALRRMARGKKRGEKYRVFVGYAGWGAGQLEREVARGSWYITEADEKLIFDKAPSDLWHELINRRSGIMVKLLLPDEGRQVAPLIQKYTSSSR